MTVMNKKGPTIRYGILQAGFWMDYLIIASFAAVFLGARGFDTGTIGIITALGALFSCVLQQVTGSFADSHDNIPLKYFVMLFIGVCCISFVMLLILPHEFMSTAIFYIVALSLQAALTPLMNSLSLQFTNNGYSLNFGLARSMGSFGYACSALVMGNIVNMFGSEIILPIYLAIYAVLLFILFSFPVPKKDTSIKPTAGKELLKDEKPSTMKEFFHKYHRFLFLMVSFIFLWLGNNIVGNYLIYFVQDLGGNSADMGLALSVMAFSEIPIVLFGNNIMSRIGPENMLRISAVGGIIKAVLLLIAPNIQLFVIFCVSHILISGFYQVSSIYYCYSIVGKQDIIKGQSILGIATSGICVMIANFLGGFLMELLDHKMILTLSVLSSCIACAMVFYAVSKKHFKNEVVRHL